MKLSLVILLAEPSIIWALMTPEEYFCRERKQAAGYKEIGSYVLQTVRHMHPSQTPRL